MCLIFCCNDWWLVVAKVEIIEVGGNQCAVEVSAVEEFSVEAFSVEVLFVEESIVETDMVLRVMFRVGKFK